MRLINVNTLKVEEFFPSHTPPYAILSHRWTDEEVSFQDMQQLDQARQKRGFEKIEGCCRQAKTDGLSYAWVDTCCIDKSSSAELSEALNSMFTWYSASEVCYAYLQDVETSDDFEEKLKQMAKKDDPPGKGPIVWFTRGWTLQELIAPYELVFYSRDWLLIGSREEFQEPIASGTGISRDVLNRSVSLDEIPVASRMSWASRRITGRKEDEAYCLLGLFDISMPILYGEGKTAFQRLQEEILRKTEDQTMFLWGSRTFDSKKKHGLIPLFFERGFLASSPRDFLDCPQARPVMSSRNPSPALSSRQRGIQLSLRLTHLEKLRERLPYLSFFQDYGKHAIYLAGLNCVMNTVSKAYKSTAEPPAEPPISTATNPQETRIAIFLRPYNVSGERTTIFTRVGNQHVLVPKEEMENWKFSTCCIRNPKNDEFIGGKLYWRGDSFGYEQNRVVDFLDIGDALSSFGLRNLHTTPDRIFGALLSQSTDLPWLMFMLGLDRSNEMVFCDIWSVPPSIVEKVIAIEEEGIVEPKHRARVISEIRFWDIYVCEGGPRWVRQLRSDGLLTRSSCRIHDKLQATVSVMSDSLKKIYIHAREHQRGGSKPKVNNTAQEWADEAWRHVEWWLIDDIRRGECDLDL